MKSHVVQSINIIKHILNLVDTIPIIISCHERYDGKGYPRGLNGEDIPLFGRILCIANAFDTMTTNTIYRKSIGRQRAVQELKDNAGKQFDPTLVGILIKMINRGDLDNLYTENSLAY